VDLARRVSVIDPGRVKGGKEREARLEDVSLGILRDRCTTVSRVAGPCGLETPETDSETAVERGY